jgi:hypothetical protein
MAIDMVRLREIVASLEAHVAELKRMIDAAAAEEEAAAASDDDDA